MVASNLTKIRKTLERVLKDESVFKASAKLSFEQFDHDNNKALDYNETKEFFARLCANLTVPPISDSTLRVIFTKYDSRERDGLSIDDFCRMVDLVVTHFSV